MPRKAAEDPYKTLENLTLELLSRLISDALEDPESTPPAALLGTAVSLLRAGGVPTISNQRQAEETGTSKGWFQALPENVQASFLAGNPNAKRFTEPEPEPEPSLDSEPKS